MINLGKLFLKQGSSGKNVLSRVSHWPKEIFGPNYLLKQYFYRNIVAKMSSVTWALQREKRLISGQVSISPTF